MPGPEHFDCMRCMLVVTRALKHRASQVSNTAQEGASKEAVAHQKLAPHLGVGNDLRKLTACGQAHRVRAHCCRWSN